MSFETLTAQLTAFQQQVTAQFEALNSKVKDLTGRIDRIEGQLGLTATKTEEVFVDVLASHLKKILQSFQNGALTDLKHQYSVMFQEIPDEVNSFSMENLQALLEIEARIKAFDEKDQEIAFSIVDEGMSLISKGKMKVVTFIRPFTSKIVEEEEAKVLEEFNKWGNHANLADIAQKYCLIRERKREESNRKRDAALQILAEVESTISSGETLLQIQRIRDALKISQNKEVAAKAQALQVKLTTSLRKPQEGAEISRTASDPGAFQDTEKSEEKPRPQSFSHVNIQTEEQDPQELDFAAKKAKIGALNFQGSGPSSLTRRKSHDENKE